MFFCIILLQILRLGYLYFSVNKSLVAVQPRYRFTTILLTEMAFSQGKYIRVPVLEALPSSPDSQKIFNHWEKMLVSFLAVVAPSTSSSPSDTSTSSSSLQATPSPAINKLAIPCGYVSPDVYAFIESCTTYDTAMEALGKLYKKKKNLTYARHLLATANQEPGETVIDFSQRLLNLSKDCSYSAVDANEHAKEAVRDALIAGLKSPDVRLRLLEHDNLDLDEAVRIADSVERAQAFSSSYDPTHVRSPLSNVNKNYSSEIPTSTSQDVSAIRRSITNESKRKSCYYCGGYHTPVRRYCPAKDVECHRCRRKGHFSKVCRSNANQVACTELDSREFSQIASIIAAFPKSLEESKICINIKGKDVQA